MSVGAAVISARGGDVTLAVKLGQTVGVGGRLLSAPMAGLLLLGYTAAVTLAVRLTPRRDVL